VFTEPRKRRCEVVGVHMCAAGDVMRRAADRPAELAHRLAGRDVAQCDRVSARNPLGNVHGSTVDARVRARLQVGQGNCDIVLGRDAVQSGRLADRGIHAKMVHPHPGPPKEPVPALMPEWAHTRGAAMTPLAPTPTPADEEMTGAESLVRTLVAAGVDTCFANPGTSEMQFVAALDRVTGMRPVPCLFEGVATGAADGYVRMSGRPAATLLHLGPGLANGLSNLHNARRALSPIVNVVGEHALSHRQFDPPLTSDIEGFARPVSAFVRTAQDVGELGRDAAQAVAAARSTPGVATLIVPADVGWSKGGKVAAPMHAVPPRGVDPARIAAAASALKSAKRPALLMSGRALLRAPLELAGRIAAATGARLYCDFLAPRLERGAGLVPVRRLSYFGEQVLEELKGTDL